MTQNWWMSATQLKRYQDLSSELLRLQKEHQALTGKVADKTISAEEATRLREVIRTFNQLHTERKKLEDENPLKPDNLMKALSDK